MSNDKRYIKTVDLYFWAESDEKAIKQAEDFAQELRKDSDNQCKVVSVHDASDTFNKPRKIK
jgi:hypothetical protein